MNAVLRRRRSAVEMAWRVLDHCAVVLRAASEQTRLYSASLASPRPPPAISDRPVDTALPSARDDAAGHDPEINVFFEKLQALQHMLLQNDRRPSPHQPVLFAYHDEALRTALAQLQHHNELMVQLLNSTLLSSTNKEL